MSATVVGPERWLGLLVRVVGLFIAAVLVAALVGTVSFDSRPTLTGVGTRGANSWANVPLAARDAIFRDIGRDQSPFAVRHAGAQLVARGPGISTTFNRHGAVVHGGAGISLQLGLEAIGRGGSLVDVGSATPVGKSNTVSYSHSAVDEWYASGPLGLEQGFTVDRRTRGRGQLTLVVGRVPRGVHATVAWGGEGLSVASEGGASRELRYSNLAVTDAAGRRVDAKMAIADGRILLRVRDVGARYPLTIDPTVQAGGAQLVDNPGMPTFDAFGSSVAISEDGGTIAVGASGAVYVFTVPSNGVWQWSTPTAELTTSDGNAASDFGSSVAVSGDGKTIIVGASQSYTGYHQAYNDEGVAYVFTEPVSGGWRDATQNAVLTPSDGVAGGAFGTSVGVSEDGATIVVGAPGPEGFGSGDGDGAAYVFRKPTGGWVDTTQTAELTASDRAAGDMFGTSVGVTTDGGTIVVGAPAYEAVFPAGGQGSAYVFSEPTSGWVNATQTAELTPSDGAASDGFGSSVGVSASGGTIVAGSGTDAYVFSEPLSGGWRDATQTAELGSGGSPVAVSGDGGTIVATGGINSQPFGLTVGVSEVFTQPASGGWQNTSQAAELLARQYLPELTEAVAGNGAAIVVGAVSRGGGTDGVMVWPQAPVASAPPAVSGQAVQGQGLTDTGGSWSSDTSGIDYQWEDCDINGANCLPIQGATGPGYTLTSSDVGHTVVVQETGYSGNFNEFGVPERSAPTGVVQGLSATSLPTVAGQAVQGSTLSDTNATWSTTVTGYYYQWEDCDAAGANCFPISGAHGQSYTPTSHDVGHTLVVQETAFNAGGAGPPVVSDATAVVQGLLATSLPTVAGQAVQGQTLTETNASWSTTVTGYAYQWEDCDLSGANCFPISGARGQSYTLTSGDVGYTIEVQETASNAGGAGPPVVSDATAAVRGLLATSAPTIAGHAVQGQALTETNASWNTTVDGFVYQWEECDSAGGNCVPIVGANGQTYTLTNADAGHTIEVEEDAFNDGGYGVPAGSKPTGVVMPLAPTSAQVPIVSGNAVEGGVLSASPIAWANTPSSVSYQWEGCDSSGHNCTPISGGTGKTYTPVATDVGARIVVAETATNAGGTSSPAMSAATAAIGESGPVGLEIDNGDYATNNPNVTIEAVWPAGTQSILISNDGGFRTDTQTVAPAATIGWTLEQTGNDRLPKTVYLRFLGVGQDDINFTDDIILDETAPTVQSATVSGPGAAQASAARAQHIKTYKLHLKAKDQMVGVCEVATNRTASVSGEVLTSLTSCKLRGIPKLSRTLKLKLGSQPRYVRVENSAGDWSRWVAVKSRRSATRRRTPIASGRDRVHSG